NVLAARGAAAGIHCPPHRGRRQFGETTMTEPPDHRDPEDAARRERTRAYQRAWDNANRERVNADKRQRYAADPDYRTTQVGYRRAWEEANRDRVNAAKRDRRAADPEYRAMGRTWWEANRERINADKRQRYATDSDYRAKILAAQKKTRRAGELRRKYGLSLQDYDRMFARQRGICPMCRKKFKRTPCVDHSQLTGLVRGLLCRNCNIGFGNFFIPRFCGAPPTTANSLPRISRSSCAAILPRGKSWLDCRKRCCAPT